MPDQPICTDSQFVTSVKRCHFVTCLLAPRRPVSRCHGYRWLRPAAAAFGGVTGQLLLMLNLNHTNKQQDKPEKFSWQ